jgi:hypothetical protein
LKVNECPGSGSGGSVIYWPSGSGAVRNIQILIILSEIQRNFRKSSIFLSFYDIPYYFFDNVFLTMYFLQRPQKCLQMATKMSNKEWSGSVRNIYGFGTPWLTSTHLPVVTEDLLDVGHLAQAETLLVQATAAQKI